MTRYYLEYCASDGVANSYSFIFDNLKDAFDKYCELLTHYCKLGNSMKRLVYVKIIQMKELETILMEEYE